MSKRAADPPVPAPKRARRHSPALAPSLDTWLKPTAAAPLLASSPPLHASSSTFIAFALSFVPPSTVRSAEALKKEAARAVQALDVVRLVGPELVLADEGAFAHGEGRAPGRREGKERAREPDHRMWAVRTLALAEGRDGTRGEGDYQLLETCDDDGERYGGDRVLRTLKEAGAVDVLTIVCRWFGGDMLGPARFTHIATVAHTSSKELVALVTRRDLRAAIVALDREIAEMRETIAAAAAAKPPDTDGAGDGGEGRDGKGEENGEEAKSGGPSSTPTPTPTPAPATAQTYEDIDDIGRLQRLLRTREMTQKSLEKRVGWAAMEQARIAG